MRVLSVCCLCIALLLACEGQGRERRAARGDTFVSDPDHLFFQNIRSRDYREITLEEGINAYYHDEQEADPELVIVDYWLEDRALLLADERTLSVGQALQIRDSLRTTNAKASLEVLEDYLRLVGR